MLSPESSLPTRGLTDDKRGAGRSLNAYLRTEMGYRDGARPIMGTSGLSTVSARSGNTVFYDVTGGHGTYASAGTTSSPRHDLHWPEWSRSRSLPLLLSGEPIRAPDDSELPPAYEPTVLGSSKKDELGDILDAPVPPSRVAICISIIRKGIVSTARPGPLTSSDYTKYAWRYQYRPFGRGTPCCGRKLEAVDSGRTKPARATNDFWLG
jgi:hypothetical protein